MKKLPTVFLSAWALLALASESPRAATTPGLADQLTTIRDRVLVLEKNLIESLKSKKKAQSNLKKIQLLGQLQREERALGKKRLEELERTIGELEARRVSLNKKIEDHRKSIGNFLTAVERSVQGDVGRKSLIPVPEQERWEAPRRKVLANLTSRSLKEIEILKADRADADLLAIRISEEKQQLSNLFQDLKEKEGVLEMNRRLQADLLERNHEDRVNQLDNYRKLKAAEAHVERLITEFNARLELERTAETEKVAAKAMTQGAFTQLKGRLPLPVQNGKVVSSFGRAFDSKSGLHVFRKGIDILAGLKEPVRAISAGKIAYSGQLPSYGQVTIIDHGEHYYSLVANLGELSRKPGDPVAAGDVIGSTDDTGTPVYFEIRARNVAVNPLQWVSN